MATRTDVVLICDACNADDSIERPVSAHTIAVDETRPVARELCSRCWNKIVSALAIFGKTVETDGAESGAVCLDCDPARSFANAHGLRIHRARTHETTLAAAG